MSGGKRTSATTAISTSYARPTRGISSARGRRSWSRDVWSCQLLRARARFLYDRCKGGVDGWDRPRKNGGHRTRLSFMQHGRYHGFTSGKAYAGQKVGTQCMYSRTADGAGETEAIDFFLLCFTNRQYTAPCSPILSCPSTGGIGCGPFLFCQHQGAHQV